MSENPFKEGSTQYEDFETMRDLKWHCTKCELKSGQAKTWQVWRQEKGIKMKKYGDDYYKKMYCPNCQKNTIHRALESTDIDLTDSKARTNIPPALAKRIKEFYGYIDAFTLRKEAPNKLEIDHRFPQVRWNDNETENSIEMTNEEITRKFMLLTRENNLLKSRDCEKCKKTGLRAKGYGISFWFKGDEEWDNQIGCEGCFWNNPEKWRLTIDKILNNGKEKK